MKSARNLGELEPAIFKDMAGSLVSNNQPLTIVFLHAKSAKNI